MNNYILQFYQNKYNDLNRNEEQTNFENIYDILKNKYRLEDIDSLTIEQYNNLRLNINDFKLKIGSKKLSPKYFGVYIVGNKKKFNTRFGNTFESAFSAVKENIKNLITYATQETFDARINSKFNTNLTNIILSIYNNKKYLPIDSKDVDYFLMIFGEIEDTKSYFEKQSKLIKLKNKTNDNWDNFNFAKFLYFVKNTNEIERIEDEADRQNNINALYFITHHEEQQNNKKETHIFNFKTNENWYLSKPKEVIKNGHKYYKRNKKVVASVLENAQECELCNAPIYIPRYINSINRTCNYCHPTFERKKDPTLLYFEAHHLIPMKKAGEMYNKYAVNIDIPENIVPLCSVCHNEIHYGKNNDRLIHALFAHRQSALQAVGIDINLTDLLKMYN